MRRLNLALTLFAGAAFGQAAVAQDASSPFAEQPYRPGASNEVTLLSLSDVMAISQMRHIKLWQAAKLDNWALAAYEADKLKDSLYRAAALYVNIPVELVKAADGPLTAISEAAKKADRRGLEKGFADLTMSCNACHQAAGLEFIRIRTPSASPFTDQDFTPPPKPR